MNMTDEMVRLWQVRATGDPDWYKRSYEAAVARVEDHTSEVEHGSPNPYWHSAASGYDAFPSAAGGGLQDDLGFAYTPDAVRQAAFEMLVLADLAEASR